MTIKTTMSLLLYFLLYCTSYANTDITNFISPDGTFFKENISSSSRGIIGDAKFRWVEELTKLSSMRGVSIFNIPVTEAIIELSDNIPDKIILSLYNRGDDKHLTNSQFQALIEKTSNKISSLTKSKPSKPERKTIKYATTETTKWERKHLVYTLTSSYTRKHKTKNISYETRFEYVKLEIASSKNNNAIRADLKSLQKNVQKDGNYTIIKNIPMVDQGQKGYCAVASLDRILQLYNINADQHYLAQLANSSASSGTSTEAMATSLRRAGTKLGFRLKFLQEFDIKLLEKITRKYDKLAKKNKTSEVGNLMQYGSISQIFQIMGSQHEMFTEVTSSLTEFKKFKTIIKNYIDKGMPILWGLVLGIVPEDGNTPQIAGGHMRLIIGYNFSQINNEIIIFSDSWGLGHEEKTIKLKDAFAVTTAVAIVEP